MEDDFTDGYSNGDECPDCGGLVHISHGGFIPEVGTITYADDDVDEQSEIVINYAQCAECSWNTFPN